MTFEFSRLRWGQTRLRQYILWTLVPVLAFLLYRIIFRSQRSRQRKLEENDTVTVWPGLDSEFYQLEKSLAEQGTARQTGEPLSNGLRRVAAAPALRELRPLLGVLRLHYRYRLDPQGISGSERETLRHEAATACQE